MKEKQSEGEERNKGREKERKEEREKKEEEREQEEEVESMKVRSSPVSEDLHRDRPSSPSLSAHSHPLQKGTRPLSLPYSLCPHCGPMLL